MQTYLMSLVFYIWKQVVTGYTTPTTPLIYTTRKNASENDEKDMNTILYGLSESQLVNVMHCKSVKEIWNKIQNIHKGDDKVKNAKLQTHRRQFESLKMKD